MINEFSSEEVRQSLKPGLAEAALDTYEGRIGCKLPEAVRALYSVHNGQALEFDDAFDDNMLDGHDPPGFHESISHGLFGGYQVYRHWVNTRLLSLERSKRWTDYLKDKQNLAFGEAAESSVQIIAMTFNSRDKVHLLNRETGQVFVRGRDTLVPACPERGERTDGMLCWLEEFARRLATGFYQYQANIDIGLPEGPLSGLSLFPRRECETRSTAVTNGVLVDCTALAQPEHATRSAGGVLDVNFAYCVEFTMLPLAEQERLIALHDPRVRQSGPLLKAQLKSRHWRFADDAGEVDRVDGDAVVGEYPIVSVDIAAPFVYQSQSQDMKQRQKSTPATHKAPAMAGHFKFVEGTLSNPTGGTSASLLLRARLLPRVVLCCPAPCLRQGS